MNEKRFFWSALGYCFVVFIAGNAIAQWRGVIPVTPVEQAKAQAPQLVGLGKNVHPVATKVESLEMQPAAYVIPQATWSGSDTMCKAYYTEISQLRPLLGNSAANDRMIRSTMASAQAYIDLNCR